jgi:protoporphyrinogen oxidase
MTGPRVVILGGGLAGMAAAWTLADAGVEKVTVVERGSELGGLAGTFEQAGNFYPLGYHHILHRDRTLLYVLERIGALDAVRWRRVHMLFRLGGRSYDLARPVDFAQFPMSWLDKLAFVRMMLRAFGKSDWNDWHGRTGAELVDSWARPGVRLALFESLSRLKFDLPCAEVSGAWLGARLHFREGSSPLGYIPGENWTQRLCRGLERLLREKGVEIRTCTAATALRNGDDRITAVELDGGERLPADHVVSTVPTEVYTRLAGTDSTPGLASIRYTALLSAICATRTEFEPDFYWMNLASRNRTACGIFRLESLNPTIGDDGESTVNFVTHLPGRDHPLFRRDDAYVWQRYLDDFEGIFRVSLEPEWRKLNRVAMYSPVFRSDYENPPVRSSTWSNVYFAGNFRTFPSVASTGTAMASGIEAGVAVLDVLGNRSRLADEAASFKLGEMPKA